MFDQKDRFKFCASLLSVFQFSFAVEISVLTRVENKTKLIILEDSEVSELIKEFEAKEEENKKADERKKQTGGS